MIFNYHPKIVLCQRSHAWCCRWDLWHLGPLKIVVQSHLLPSMDTSALPEHGGPQNPDADPAEGKAMGVIVQAKLEYHSQKAAQGELITDAELMKWWLASKLHLGVPVWVRNTPSLRTPSFIAHLMWCETKICNP